MAIHEEKRVWGCDRCFQNDDVESGLSNEVHRRTDRLVDDSHLGVSLAECLHCGQPSVMVFVEQVDWQGGDDAQYFDVIALTPTERDRLRTADESAVPALVEDIGSDRVRLYWSHPTGGRRKAGRAANGFFIRSYG